MEDGLGAAGRRRARVRAARAPVVDMVGKRKAKLTEDEFVELKCVNRLRKLLRKENK